MSVKPGVGYGQRHYIRLRSGNDFNFDLKDNKYLISDIAHALANIGRYVGHTDVFYSVAQHSVAVSRLSPSYPLWGLLHDASEAYIGDLSSPLKALLPEYKRLEKRVMAQICETFGLASVEPPEVKQADLTMLATEGRDLFVHGWPYEEVSAPPVEDIIKPWGAGQAREEFIERYMEIVQ